MADYGMGVRPPGCTCKFGTWYRVTIDPDCPVHGDDVGEED